MTGWSLEAAAFAPLSITTVTDRLVEPTPQAINRAFPESQGDANHGSDGSP